MRFVGAYLVIVSAIVLFIAATTVPFALLMLAFYGYGLEQAGVSLLGMSIFFISPVAAGTLWMFHQRVGLFAYGGTLFYQFLVSCLFSNGADIFWGWALSLYFGIATFLIAVFVRKVFLFFRALRNR